MDALPTLKIQDGTDGYKIINKSDFDPSVHQIYTPKKTKGSKNSDPPPLSPDSDEG